MKHLLYYIFALSLLLAYNQTAEAQSSCSLGGSQTEMQLAVPNLSDQTLEVYWINFECNEQLTDTISPNSVFYQTTYDGHEWVFRDPSGTEVTRFTSSTSNPVVLIGAGAYNPAPVTSECSNSATDTETPLSVINNTDERVLLNWIARDCTESTYGVVQSNDRFNQSAFIGTDWVIRHLDGRVAAQIKVESGQNTVIIDPPSGAQAPAITCNVQANGANTRSEPTTQSNQVGPLNGTATAIAQTTGADGFVWYQLNDNSWIRSDVVSADASCANLPLFGASSVQVQVQQGQQVEQEQPETEDFQSVQPGSFSGRILFIKFDENDGQDIYSMNADGTDEVRLTQTGNNTDPVVSPDGSRIVFTNFGDDDEIFIMNVDGTNIQQLTNNDVTHDFHPTFSPDGNRILFASNRSGNDEIYTMNTDGTDVQQITNRSDHDFHPEYSPDGSQIVFVSDLSNNLEIFVMNADGTNVVQLTNNGANDSFPQFSPDGSKIAFRSDRDGDNEVYIINADGSNIEQVTNNNNAQDSRPFFSPDGNHIVFYQFGQDEVGRLLIMNVDGSNPQFLVEGSRPMWYGSPVAEEDTTSSETTETAETPAEAEPEGIVFVRFDGNDVPDLYNINPDGSGEVRLTQNGYNYDPVVSPDGSQIVFAHWDGVDDEIVIMSADGSTLQLTNNEVTHDFHPVFSPDGNLILFASNRSGNDEIYTMNTDGTNVQQITNRSDHDFHPVFSPDGSKILFTSDLSDNLEIFSMDADGSNIQQLTNDAANDSFAQYSPDGSQITFRSNRDGDYEIYVMNADGSNVQQLTNNSLVDTRPFFSPDGTQILYMHRQEDGVSRLYIMNADGSDSQVLVEGDRPMWYGSSAAEETTEEAPTSRSSD